MIFKSGTMDDIILLIDEPLHSDPDLKEACIACFQLIKDLAEGNDEIKRYLFEELPRILQFSAMSDPAVVAAMAMTYMEVFDLTQLRLDIK